MYEINLDLSTSMMFNCNQLTLLKFIIERDCFEHSIYSFYEKYFENCIKDNVIYDIFEHIEITSRNYFENISIDYYRSGDWITLIINFTKDSYDYIAYEYYLKELGYQVESTYETIDEIIGDQLTDHLECDLFKDGHIRLGINYGDIEDYSFYLIELELVDSLKVLIKLDKLISERKFLFKLKGFNKLFKPISIMG